MSKNNRKAWRQEFEHCRWPTTRQEYQEEHRILAWNEHTQSYYNELVEAEFEVWVSAMESTGVVELAKLMRSVVTDLKRRKMLSVTQVKHVGMVLEAIDEVCPK